MFDRIIEKGPKGKK